MDLPSRPKRVDLYEIYDPRQSFDKAFTGYRQAARSSTMTPFRAYREVHGDVGDAERKVLGLPAL